MQTFERFEDALRVRASQVAKQSANDYMVGYLLSMVQLGNSYQHSIGLIEQSILSHMDRDQDEQTLVDLMWQNAKIA
jgi:hypothetical protein